MGNKLVWPDWRVVRSILSLDWQMTCLGKKVICRLDHIKLFNYLFTFTDSEYVGVSGSLTNTDDITEKGISIPGISPHSATMNGTSANYTYKKQRLLWVNMFASIPPPPTHTCIHTLFPTPHRPLPPVLSPWVRQETITSHICNRQNIYASLLYWSAELQTEEKFTADGWKEEKFAYLSLSGITPSILRIFMS